MSPRFLTAALTLALAAPLAHASTQVSVSINTPGFGVRVGAPPLWGAPGWGWGGPVVIGAPVIVAPPVAVAPSPVFVPAPVFAPPPVIAAPVPVFVARPPVYAPPPVWIRPPVAVPYGAQVVYRLPPGHAKRLRRGWQ
jgi:hypothetical protein